MTVKLIKEAPPAPGTRGRKPGEVSLWLKAIREEGSGDWFKYPKRVHTSAAVRIKNGGYNESAPGEFDAVIRDTAKSRGTLYVRFVE